MAQVESVEEQCDLGRCVIGRCPHKRTGKTDNMIEIILNDIVRRHLFLQCPQLGKRDAELILKCL